MCFPYQVRDKMESCMKDMQVKLRSVQSQTLNIKELRDRKVISHEMYKAFEEAKQIGYRRRKKENVLEWWLGWWDHGQLLKLSRQIRLDVCQNMAKAAAITKEDEIEEDVQEDFERPCTYDDDIIEDIDDEDYSQELNLAGVQSIFESTPEANVQKDEQLIFDDLDDEEQSLSAFAKGQSKRMDFIRNQLLTIPPETPYLNENIYPNNVIELPFIQRWMLFAEWKRKYQDIVYRDLCDTQKEYENHIKEYNQLKANALAALCRTVDVIGLTTTGAARNRLLLEALKAKIGNFSYIRYLPLNFFKWEKNYFCSYCRRGGRSSRIAYSVLVDIRLPTFNNDR